MVRTKYRRNVNAKAVESNSIYWFNGILLAVILLLLAYYIVSANTLTSINYRIQNLETLISKLSENNAALAEQRLKIENVDALAQFAILRGMVESSTPNHIFTTSGVALNR
jgi:predicted ferric reductase